MLKLEENILKVISLLMIFGAAIYYFYSLNWLGILLTIILSGVTFYFLRTKKDKTINSESTKKIKINFLPIIFYLLITILSFLTLIKSSSDQALISPWTVTPEYFFFLYCSATALLFFILNQKLSDQIKIWLLRIHYFLSFTVAAIIYQIGYGFDPFIHQATVELIDKQGYVDPKTPYYLGQYALITIIHKISGLSIYLLNKFLVPLLAAWLIPGIIFKFTSQYFSGNTRWFIILSLLCLPFNIFILSTPQNLSYLWLVLIIFYSLIKTDKYFLVILGLAALAIHPLAGIPVIFFIAWNFLENYQQKLTKTWRKMINLSLWFFATLSLPLSFTIITGQSWYDLTISFQKLSEILTINILNTNIAGVITNFPYLFNNIFWPIFITLSAYGLIIWHHKDKNKTAIFIKVISSLFVSFLLSASLSFDFLIDYERDNYIARLPIIIILFTLPAFIIALQNLITKILDSNKEAIIGAWVIFSLFITCSLYLSYPRLDAYVNSRGYSVSSADLRAVKLIAEKSTQNYIVLANQQTSVASLKELGFDNYFDTPQGKIFFYPIPTGGELYKYYLKMVNEDISTETMKSAMDLVGVKESYLVINKYWWLSNRLIAAAKIKADTYWVINDGEIYIFQFKY